MSIKSFNQYNYIENVLSHYNSIGKIINTLKFSHESHGRTVEEVMSILGKDLDFNSYVIFIKDGNHYDAFSCRGIFEKVCHEISHPIFNPIVNELLKYGDGIIEKNQLRENSRINDFFSRYEISYPNNLIIIPLMHRNNQTGVICIAINDRDIDSFIYSSDFISISEIIGLLISYHLSSYI